jgi:hypothetical protein
VHIVGPGSCQITASQGGNGTYSAANDAQQTFNVSKLNQTITLGAPSGKDFSSPDFDPGATASSSLPVSYSSSTPTVCTMVGGKVHVVSAGDCTITASQGGNDNYNAAQDASVTFNVAKAPQTVNLAAPSDRFTVAPDFDPGAGASSGLPVSYSSSTQDVCTVVAGKVHIVGVGNCSITASQAGNGNYNAAQDVTKSFAVTKPKEPPTVTITTPADGASYYQYQSIAADYSCQPAAGVQITSCVGDVNQGSPIDTSTPGSHSFKVTAQDNAGNQAQKTVNYTVIAVGTAQGGGTFVIGNRNASVGSQVTYWGSQWAKVNSLSGGSAPDSFKGYAATTAGTPPKCGDLWSSRDGDSSKPPASVPQYMAVIASSNITKSGPTTSGDTATVVVVKTNPGYDSNPGHAGTGTVVARLCGNKLTQTIGFNALADRSVTDADFDAGATASSGLPVGYSSSTPDVCAIVGGKVDIVGTGNCTITASQAGNDVYGAAADVSRTFAVSLAGPLNCNDKKSKVKCESLLINPSLAASATASPGQTLTIGYTDDSAIGSGSLAPTAQLNNGQSLPVTVTPTSGQPFGYVTGYKRDFNAKNQSLLNFSLPTNLQAGSYSVLVTVYDGDGDVDQWNWPVTVVSR